MKKICATCNYWAPFGGLYSIHGSCMRHAPSPCIEGIFEEMVRRISGDHDFSFVEMDQPERLFSATWPVTFDELWCGEWQEKAS